MIAARMLGASFGVEWAGVCTALWARPRMPWPRVRVAPTVRAFRLCARRGVPCSSEGQTLKGRARSLCLAPTIQSEGEAFQGGELDYVVSKKRSSCLEYTAAKGRFQPPYMGDKPEAENTPAFAFAGDPCGPNKEEVLGTLPVTRFELAPSGGLDVCPPKKIGVVDLFAINNRRNRRNIIHKDSIPIPPWDPCFVSGEPIVCYKINET